MTISIPRPVFDPETALGWSDIALDGLSCYLRCVEATLAAAGSDVVGALAAPLRLIGPAGQGLPNGEFPGCTVHWRQSPVGESLWTVVVDRLADGAYTVVSPDSYWWPGDELNGRVHGHHHMVLPVEVGSQLTVLDTDSPAANGYTRVLAVDDDLKRSVNAIGLIEPTPGPTWTVDALIRESADAGRADTAELRAMAQAWARVPPSPMLARAMHVLVLGEVQPPLYLFARALDGEPDPAVVAVRAGALTAAARAKKLGLLLTGLHRFESATLYGICLGELEQLVAGLDALCDAMAGWRGSASSSDAGTRVAVRLDALASWCFEQPDHLATAWMEGSA